MKKRRETSKKPTDNISDLHDRMIMIRITQLIYDNTKFTLFLAYYSIPVHKKKEEEERRRRRNRFSQNIYMLD